MAFFKRKQTKKKTLVGFKNYRTPSVFNSGERLVKKENRTAIKIKLPPIKVFIYLALFLFVFWIFCVSNYFKIKDVFVEGNSLVPKETVVAYAPLGKNIFSLGIKSTRQKILREHPEIKEVIIYKGLPNAVKFSVLEEEPKIVWQTGNQKYLISVDGKVAKLLTGDEFNNLPVVIDKKDIAVSPGQKIISPNFITFVMNLNNNFFDQTGIKLTHFEISETTFDVNAYTDASFYVKFNTMRASSKQLDDLKLVLRDHRPDIHEYVDLRIEGWGYYK